MMSQYKMYLQYLALQDKLKKRNGYCFKSKIIKNY